jgi:hypothetical protein
MLGLKQTRIYDVMCYVEWFAERFGTVVIGPLFYEGVLVKDSNYIRTRRLDYKNNVWDCLGVPELIVVLIFLHIISAVNN